MFTKILIFTFHKTDLAFAVYSSYRIKNISRVRCVSFRSVIKRLTDSTKSTTSGQTDITSGQTDTTGGQTSTTSE